MRAAVARQRDDLDADVTRAVQVQPVAAHRETRFAGLPDRRQELDQELWTDDAPQIETRRAAGRLEEWARPPAKLLDIESLIHQEAGRRKPGQQPPVGLSRERVGLEGTRQVGRLLESGIVVRAPAPPCRAHPGAGPSTVNAKALVHLLEQLGRLADRFGGTDQQHPVRTQREVQGLEDPPLGDLVQVDEQIAATDEIEARERRVPRHVLPREDAQVTDLFSDPVAVAESLEKTLQALVRNVSRDVAVVHAGPRPLERRLADIGSKDLHLRGRKAIAHELQELDHDRVHLFAGGTSRHPDPDRLPRAPAVAQGREHVLPQRLGGVRIAEEFGDPYQEILVERG